VPNANYLILPPIRCLSRRMMSPGLPRKPGRQRSAWIKTADWEW